MLYFIYKLIDCRREGIKAIFYVGITDNPNERFEQHLRCDNGESEQKNAYIRDMLTEGATPKIEIIEIIDESCEQAIARETFSSGNPSISITNKLCCWSRVTNSRVY